ncbi:MAG: TonB-dependent siderophore receptor [Candidatus Accumulibacter sp.]|jgi:iron complex outermembrane receptor protein|nr:TonB-dependent siderophore receptor [Accumulibacter sp.]
MLQSILIAWRQQRLGEGYTSPKQDHPPKWAVSGQTRFPMNALKRASGARVCLGVLVNLIFLPGTYAQADETSQQLPPVIVWGERETTAPHAGGQVSNGTSVGILGNKKIMDTPFNATGYTSEYVENTQAKTVQEVLKNDPTVRFQYNPGAMVESMYIRGFTYNVNNASLNGMAGMAPSFSVATEMLERIEGLRGPGAFLNGLDIGSEPNGGLNLVLKRALPADFNRITMDYLSSGQAGGHLDVSRRFGPNREFGIRFNGAARDGATGVKGQHQKRSLASIALDYTSDRWMLNLDAYYVKNEFDGAGPFLVQTRNMSAANILVPQAPKYKNGIKGLYGSQESSALLFQGQYKINEYLKAYLGAGYAETEASGFYGGGTIVNPDAQGIGTLNLTQTRAKLEKSSYEAGLRGKFDTGKIKHNVVAGWSLLELTQFQLNGSLPGSAINIPGVSMYDPVFNASLIPNVKPGLPKLQRQELSSLIFADTLDYRNGLIQLTLGVRKQDALMDTYNQTTGLRNSRYDKSVTTPMFGLVVKPFDDTLSLYLNYIEGLQRGSTVPAGFSNTGQVLAPYKTNQYEFGVKQNFGKLTHTLSFYQITRPSYISRPAPGGSLPSYSEDGEQRNRGMEWMFFGEPTRNTRILGGLVYTKTKLVKTNNGINEGNETGGFPKWQGNLGFEWDSVWDRNLTLIGRSNFNGSMYANNTNTKKIPGWATFDIGARYKTALWDRPVVFRGAIENLFNRNEFWAGARTGGVFYTMPGRTFRLSVSSDF